MLKTLPEVLTPARENRYAVGLFNAATLTMAQGIIDAAEAARSPLIIGPAEVFLPLFCLEDMAGLLLPMARRATVPVVLHFDHGLHEEVLHEAMDLGFTSIMYDCSTLPYEQNRDAVARIVKEAHRRGVSVEAELGHVGQGTDDPCTVQDQYTDPDQAADFVAQTGVDALAVAIGTAHGAYTFTPKLDLERLAQLRDKVSVPLVLHGGSGLTDEDFRACVRLGIAKINIFTDNNVAAARAAHRGFTGKSGITDLMPGMRQAVMEETIKKIKLFGSDGRV